MDDGASHPLPATGPYEVASDTPRQVTLMRNPYFHEWSHAAQPAGYPNRIVFRIGASAETAATDIEHGTADYTIDPPPTVRLHEIQTRFASQLHVEPNDVTIELGLNTRTPPFNDIRVRRAINPTRIKSVDSGLNPLVNDSRARAQAFLMVQVPSYPAASEFLGPEYFSCESFLPDTQSNLNVFEFCDPRFDATVREALAAEATGSPTASNLWAKADRQFTDQAPVVPLATPSITDFVSRRVGDYQHNPQLGVLIDQLWVH